MSLSKHHSIVIGDFYLKKVIVSVINDLATDQRVHKACLSLEKSGFKVLLVGRVLKNSPQMPSLTYNYHRMRLIFTKGPLFYAEFNIRLFLFLLFRKADLLLSNDLDTLLANYLISKLKGVKVLFDSHEYFTETPELTNRKTVQKIWKTIEKWIVPKLSEMITVNESIAELFRNEYHIKVHVIRNIPMRYKPNSTFTKAEANLPADKKILILQGAGINVQRGAEELVEAMTYLSDCFLLVIGGGDVLEQLKKIVHRHHLENNIRFLPRMPYQQMMNYTRLADIGITLDKDTNLNYRFSLPNKLFDYIHANVPVLASPLPEIKNIIDTYQTGSFIVNHKPETIARSIRAMVDDKVMMEQWKSNCKLASETLCWEQEEKLLLSIYAGYC